MSAARVSYALIGKHALSAVNHSIPLDLTDQFGSTLPDETKPSLAQPEGNNWTQAVNTVS
jgi:hypothetical protein